MVIVIRGFIGWVGEMNIWLNNIINVVNSVLWIIMWGIIRVYSRYFEK